MSVVMKTVGKNTYQYEVSWDSECKKQVWTYIGKVITNDRPVDVGKNLTNAERIAAHKMLSWVSARKRGQSGWAHRGAARRLKEIV